MTASDSDASEIIAAGREVVSELGVGLSSSRRCYSPLLGEAKEGRQAFQAGRVRP